MKIKLSKCGVCFKLVPKRHKEEIEVRSWIGFWFIKKRICNTCKKENDKFENNRWGNF